MITLPLALLLLLLSSPALAGELIVRSRAGMPVFVSVDHFLQNPQPRHEVRVRDLDRRFVDLEISFPNRHLPVLRADRFRVDPRERTIVEVTRGRHGDLVLTLVGTEPLGYVTPGYPMPSRPAPGYYDDPYCAEVPMPLAMSPAEFAQLRRSLREVTFESDRVALAHQALAHRYLHTEQVLDLMQLYTFDRNRLEVAKLAYHRTLDPENYFLLHEGFTFRSHAQELREYVAAHPHPGWAPAYNPRPQPAPRPVPHEPGRRQPRRPW